MAFIVAFILGALALCFVLFPLFQRRERYAHLTAEVQQPNQQKEQQIELEESEQIARSAIREVELDYQLGNIAEPDYRSLRERYMRRALVALKSRYEREEEIDAEIEKQLRILKEDHEQTDS